MRTGSSIAGTRILMLAPEPMFRARGTPLSVVARLQALAELGCRVDLVTYPFGQPFTLDGVEVLRCGSFPVRREPPVGPSAGKIVLDLYLARAARRRLRAHTYHLIHTHEEAAFIGARLARRWGLPHLYDMHSSLPEQMVNYGWFRPGGLFVRWARRAERRLLRRCSAVIAVYPALADAVRAVRPDLPVVTIENPPVNHALGLPQMTAARAVPGHILYAGNLAANQGMGLLLRAMRLVRERVADARLVVIGGRAWAVRRARWQARCLGVAEKVQFRGPLPVDEALAAHGRAAVLVSPRVRGMNVPSKVYTYLAAGRPIVVTDIPAHRQILDETCAILVPPTPVGLAEGLTRALLDSELSARLAAGGRARLGERFSPADYLARIHQAVAAALGSAGVRDPAVLPIEDNR